MNDRMSREQFFEFTQEYDQYAPGLSELIELQQMLRDLTINPRKPVDLIMFDLIQDRINERFGQHTWVSNSET